MATRQARIGSYFSLPTDLAAEMRSWQEFVRGEGYKVELKNSAERVTVALIPEQDDDTQYVLVRGEGAGQLFERVLGCVAFAMAAHSDDVAVMRWRDDEA